MSVLYIQEQGAYVEKRGERLLVSKNRQVLLDIPVANVENVALLGNVQITMQLLRMLLKQGVDVSFFSYGGEYLGHACSESSRNIFLRLAQYDIYQNMEQRLGMEELLVANKIRNQIHMIEHFRWSDTEYDWKADMDKLEEQLQQISSLGENNRPVFHA